MREGWTYKKLGEVCDFQGGSQPPKEEWIDEYKEGYIRMLQIRDFTQSRAFTKEYIKITNRIKTCKKDDILIGRYGASVGKILTGEEGAYNVAIMKTIPDESVISKDFAKLFFLSPSFQHYLQTVCYSRAAQAGFSKSDISDYLIPIPPIAEQERIVAELDLLSGIIEKKKEQLKAYDQLAQSIFYTMFGTTNHEKGWEVKKLGEVGTFQRGGGFLKSDFVDVGFPCIHYGQIHTKFGAFTHYHLTSISEELAKSKSKFAHKGDVIIAITSEDVEGSCKCVAWLGNYDVAVGAHAAIFRHNLNPIYVSYYFKSSEYSIAKTRYARGFKVVEIKPDDIAKIDIPIPPLSLQQEFAEKVEAIERQKALVQQSIEETKTMFDYSMDKYFG